MATEDIDYTGFTNIKTIYIHIDIIPAGSG